MSEGKSNTGLIVGILIAVFLVCGGGATVIGFFLYVGAAQTTVVTAPGGPARALPVPAGQLTGVEVDGTQVTYPFSGTLRSFKQALLDADHEAAYALLSETYRQEVSLRDFRRQVQDFDGRYAPDPESVTTGSFRHESTPGAQNNGSWSQSAWSQGRQHTERINLVEESDGEWRIDGWVIE